MKPESAIQFLKSHFLLLALVLYGIVLIWFCRYGSFAGDEAIYAEVAREGLAKHTFLTLFYADEAWFEKPPLLIWLLMLSFKTLAISEFSARLVPGLFSIFSAALVYFLGRELFDRKLHGFLSGFVFLTSPIVLFYSRSTMMDVPVGFFISLGALALFKIYQGNERWWILFWIACGLGVMMKSVIGLIPLILLVTLCIFWKRLPIFRNRSFWWGLGWFFFIVLPWHIFVTMKYGWLFWKEYLGFHVFSRFTGSLFPFPWQGDTNMAYWDVFIERSGLWSYVVLVFFIATLGIILFQRFSQVKHGGENRYILWLIQYKRSFLFLFYFAFATVVPFLLAETKLPQYMVLVYYPLSLLVGGCVGYLVLEKKRIPLVFLACFSVLNFLPMFQERLLVFGEAQFLLAKSVNYFLYPSPLQTVALFGGVILAFVGLLMKRERKALFIGVMLSILIVGNMVVPLPAERNASLKEAGSEVTTASSGQPIRLYYSVSPEFYSFQPVMTFYLPLGSSIESVGEKKIKILPKDTAHFSSWCYIEGVVDKCEIVR